MADETYRKFHAGRYPEYKGGEGQASYEAGSKTGYYEKDEEGSFVKQTGVELKATKALRKAVGMSDTGESGIPAITRKRLKDAEVD